MSLLAIIVTATVISFGVYPIVYSQELTQALVMYKLLTLVAILVNTLVFMACITYVASIKAQMQLLIEENLGMLNNMSEGLFLADQ